MQDAFYEWDDDKAAANKRHHGVSFSEAITVFDDPGCLEFFDEAHSEEEGRFAAIGFSAKGRLLFVVFAPRHERLRIISARLPERDEEQIYEQHN
jgi:uncharacterized protein